MRASHEMDTFVEEWRRGQVNLEGETQDVRAATTTTASPPGIYLPLLPRCFHYTTSRFVMHSEFQKAKEGCLNCIQDSLLQGQLQRAAELIISYVEMLEHYTKDKLRAAPEEIWRIGTEILQRHPWSNINETNHFADQMKNLGVKGYLKVSLEHAFHLLCNGFEDEAYQNLVLAESWKYGEQTVIQNKELKLIQGYRGLLDYSKWLKKKTDMLGLDEDSYAVSSVQQEMGILYRQAKVSLKEIIKIPGVWDPFVTCYVHMLEHYEEYEEAREVLREYAYNSKFPPNPNAHVFLYQFLKRRGESRKTQRSALQILHELVPSHELMLEYYAMLKKSKKRKNQKLRLEVIFAALDSAGWKENVKAWSCLAKEIVEVSQNSDKQLHWLKNKWASRKDWWPAFHFGLYLAKRNWQEDESLACEKVLVAGMLMGKGNCLPKIYVLSPVYIQELESWQSVYCINLYLVSSAFSLNCNHLYPCTRPVRWVRLRNMAGPRLPTELHGEGGFELWSPSF
ncbi:TATA box-binding protein-associated factor RNA polymerase I subunit A isoform X1 [Zootoca vivipara]|uniref:TATA box-binding protein-associated factor RNA polymerase I subunit A isoform X1 n=2 Tax=Zootoca vivipara TaxID=8524 RepID=UPI00293BB9B8|nr:TATA box-binding protein-associated factor RNA polymerase I subunit A isoform X1 [Zootoca vivipara]